MTMKQGDAWRREESAISSPGLPARHGRAREDSALTIRLGDILPEERVQLWLGSMGYRLALLCWPRWSFLLTAQP